MSLPLLFIIIGFLTAFLGDHLPSPFNPALSWVGFAFGLVALILLLIGNK